MAAAGLAALGAAAVAAFQFADFPPERLRTVTGPLSARECAAWRAQAERFERRRAGWFAVYEGFAHLQGVCLPKDADRGRALIESAFAARLDEMLVIPYFEALSRIGDSARAAEWGPLAVAASHLNFSRTNRVYLNTPIMIGALSVHSLRTPPKAEDWAIWYPRIRTMLDRVPLLPEVESWFLDSTLLSLAHARPTETHLLRDEAVRSGRIRDVPPDRRDTGISLASRCGHPEALRRKARYFLADDLYRPFAPWIVGEIAWLHARTDTEAELVAAVLAKAGFRPDDPRIAEELELRDQIIRERCAGGETPIDRSTPR